MHGHQPRSRYGGGGRGLSQLQHQQIHLNSNFLANPNYLLHQNPSFLPNLSPFLQNPISFPQIPHHFPNSNFPFQTAHANGDSSSYPAQQHAQVQNDMVEKLDKAVERARKDLVASNENVSAWKVSQAALSAVKAESWESLGFPMQYVPSQYRLLATERKINLFVECFVAARRITSLYDLEVAICESEGINCFEELQLGPLVRHPLAVHYFSVSSRTTEVFRIRTEEIVSYLCEFVDTHKKKEVKVDAFLDFISEKLSVSCKEKLCIRIKNLRVHARHLKQARQSEDIMLEKCYEKMRTESVKSGVKRLLFSAQKKEMDEHFTELSQRVNSFSSENTQFCGKHIRFVSSSSDDNTGEDDEYENNQDEKRTNNNHSPLPNGSDRVSGCPYPSATEEMARLGLKNEVGSSPRTHGGGVRCTEDKKPARKKRRYEHMSSRSSSCHKQSNRDKSDACIKQKRPEWQSIIGSSISFQSFSTFVTTWKEACQVTNADEVFERMLESYEIRKKRKVKEMFTQYPFIGLLNAAVFYIKLGMSDNMHDIFHRTFCEQGIADRTFENSTDYTSVDVQPTMKDLPVPTPKTLTHEHGVAAEDIMKKISGYFEDGTLSYENLSLEHRFSFLRKFCRCEHWLVETYSVNKFESLGYGEYFIFLEKYMHLLPRALRNCITGGILEAAYLEAHLLPIQLDALLLQALDSLWVNEVNLHNISELLARQFPLVCFKLVNSDLPNLLDIIREKRCNIASNSVLFSTPLSRFPSQNDRKLEETLVLINNTLTGGGMSTSVTTKDAIEVLLKAPMLTDLNLWSHWDILFAPYLGPIVEWLLKGVNNKELLCLITKDGKVIRIDHSITLDTFLKVFIQGSSFETAVALLSLCAIYGERNVPLPLLKCHAQQGFKVIINNYLEAELYKDKGSLLHGKPSYDHHIVTNSTSSKLGINFPSDRSILNKAAAVMSRFILDCLSCLPVEFCSLAADVLIYGLQSFVKGVPAAILNECKRVEERLMLHEVGISLGLVEWINDFHSFYSSATTGLSPGSSCVDVINSESYTTSMTGQELGKQPSSTGEMLVLDEVYSQDIIVKQFSGLVDYAEVPDDSQASNLEQFPMIGDCIDVDPARVIESIRREEFGLDHCSSADENKMLKKQHARLGRALHCLSQELYSQDSHFILELVQNADDNTYPEVEPTLTFILQEKGIIVLNNERGFSANDIRALCDIGNSTKKDHNTGYIGKKGIGFKSVFRVTDAPEIHSNGFHIKFDITKGQIGFVLPTVVPPCDIDLYTRWASSDADHKDRKSWNTCIILPFRSNLLEGFSMSNILSMFSDLHPSLLLFLHRLQCIKFRNMLDNSFLYMRKKVIGDGIIEVAFGGEKMTWFVVSRKLKPSVISSEVQSTEISLAFTLKEVGGGCYSPILNQQPVFAFLPLRTYGLKFILQGDFTLPSSREEVDGNSLWNQWLLSEFPDLFVDAGKSFCDLPCYRGSPGKAITIFMNFVPLVGEVHGFFSCLPRMIISKLRMSNCLILEGDKKKWVPPCKVLRNWTDQTRALLPDSLLHEHVGLGYLNKDVLLSDSLANALGVEDYGPTILVRIISSLCCSDNGLKLMGLSWLSSWLSSMYTVLLHYSMQISQGLETESNCILDLRKTPFIPLLDGKYGSLDEGTIWMQSEAVGDCIIDEGLIKAFPNLYAKLRIVSPNLLSEAASVESSCSDTSIMKNAISMLHKVGVQRLSFHDIVKVHILPAISDDKSATGQEELMIEYLAFTMFHLQSSCTSCRSERSAIVEKLHDKALILTNYGYKRSTDVPIHFNLDYGSPVDVNRLINDLDMRWHEIDIAYLKHPITKFVSGGVMKWRTFLQEIGVTDFVQVDQVGQSVADVSLIDINDVTHVKSLNSTDLVSKNWVSEELLCLLSSLCARGDGLKSRYLLEILDRLWDDYFSDKVIVHGVDSKGESKSFRSSFINALQNFPWVASDLNNKLYYPKDLFHDCFEVRSVLGVTAPCTVPKVRSEKLLADIGFKTQVTLDDALYVLRLWRGSESSFRASISQMSNFYAFLWKGMVHSRKKIIEELRLGPFIFVPNTSDYMTEDAVPGVLLSPHEVYWLDPVSSVVQTKLVDPGCFTSITSTPYRRMLYHYYPNLHDFFVVECGVDISPPLRSYLQYLLQLSTTALPHQAANKVFEVFLMWDDGLKSESLSFEDAEYLKESLLKKEYTVLPTRQDKWISLHISFDLICWCDDDSLGKEFKQLDGVEFLYFGNSHDGQSQLVQAKLSTILRRLGIPALSEIVTREAVCNGTEDSSFISSLVNWVLPYAQRYLYDRHPDKYFQLKHSGFQNLRNLKIAVVEKLLYQNVIKKREIKSKKKHECNCLLQDNILYCSKKSDPHSIFLELSCLLYDGTKELHFANFLHMITTMAESGATEKQTEFFILNSQKVPKLPSEESWWSLPGISSLVESSSRQLENNFPDRVDEQNSLFKPGSNSNWLPVDWRTAPDFNSVSAHGLKNPGAKSTKVSEGNLTEHNLERIGTSAMDISSEVNIEVDPSEITPGMVAVDAQMAESGSSVSNYLIASGMNLEFDSAGFAGPDRISVPSNCTSSDRGQAFAKQALLTGRLGELVAFKYFVGKVGPEFVKWVNKAHETGLPYDIILGDDEDSREYIEVKSTISARKNWFLISMREWQLAVERGESFSIAHVVIAENNMAKVTIYKNPARLCQLGNLRLALVVPKQ